MKLDKPIILDRTPLSGEVVVIFDYERRPRLGLTDLIVPNAGGKQSVQAEYDALVLEELLGEDQGVINILLGIVRGDFDGEDIPEGDKVAIRALTKRLTAIINRHNIRRGKEPEHDVVT